MPVPVTGRGEYELPDEEKPQEPELLRMMRESQHAAASRNNGAWHEYLSSRFGGAASKETMEKALPAIKESFPPFNVGTATPGRLIFVYLASCFSYYFRNFSLISDEQFDACCDKLKAQLHQLPDHPHKYLLDWGALDAHTGRYLNYEDYHQITIRYADMWRQQEIKISNQRFEKEPNDASDIITG